MTVHCPPRREPWAARQRGQAMLLTVLLLGVGVSAVVYNFVTPAKQAVERDKITAAAFAEAKSALIGYAASNANQPGVLPCPDTDNDGSADAPCGVLGATAIGRLPWRTLGLPPLRDGMGECLWYAVSGNFKNSGVSGPPVLNSDGLGTLIVNDSSGAAVLSGSNAALAIVFAPGAPLPTQDRTPAGTSVCGGNTNVASYLDTRSIAGTPFDNATGGGTNSFLMAATAPGPTDLNDKLLPITRDALFPVVEMRVARELRLSLRNFFNEPLGTPRQYYPLPAQLPNNNPTITPGTYRGYLPTTAMNCPALDLTPYLPAWFTANNWQQFVVYAVAPGCTPKTTSLVTFLTSSDPQPPCAFSCPTSGFRTCQVLQSIDTSASNCNNTAAGPTSLTVSGDATVKAIVIPASYRLGVQPPRPCTAITDCLELVGASNENIDADNYVYIKPVRSATNNDSLAIVAP